MPSAKRSTSPYAENDREKAAPDPLSVFLLSALGVAACAATGRPIHGSALLGGETFNGTVNGPADGDGTIALTSSTGAKCSGSYTHIKLGDEGLGVGTLDLTCDDGRRGSLILANPSGEVSGFGTLGKAMLMLGDPAS
jgi:hypothetical protein